MMLLEFPLTLQPLGQLLTLLLPARVEMAELHHLMSLLFSAYVSCVTQPLGPVVWKLCVSPFQNLTPTYNTLNRMVT